MAAKSTVWPIYLIGVLCFAIAGTVAAVTLFVDWTISSAQELAIALPFLSGLAAFRAGFAERKRQRALVAETAPPAPPSRRKRARLEPPPRIGDDPFRNPPGAPPIVVERPAVTSRAPIVPGDSHVQPKLLI